MSDATMRGQIQFELRGRRHTANATLDATWRPEHGRFDCELTAVHLGVTKIATFSITDSTQEVGKQEAALRAAIKNAIKQWGWRKPTVVMVTTHVGPR